MNWRHTDFQSVALPTELPRRQPHMLPHPFSPSIELPFQSDMNPLTQAKQMYYILPQAPTLYVGPNQGKGHRSPMSRYSLHRPRRYRAVWDRPAPGTRLLPSPHSSIVSLGYHPSGDGRSIDFLRHTLSKGLCRYTVPSSGRFGVASSGHALELSFTLLPGAIVPLGAIMPPKAIAPPRAIVPIRAIMPSRAIVPSSAIVPLCDSNHRSHRSIPFGAPRRRVDVPSPSSVERCCRTDRPHTETPSNLARLLRHVWGLCRIAADVEHPLGRTLDVGAGVVVFLFKSLGPSIAFPSVPSPVGATGWSPWGGASSPTTQERNRLLAHTPIISHAHPFPSPDAPFPRKARNICLEQSNRHELLIKTIKCRRFRKAANPTHRAAHRYRLMSIL